MKHEVLNEKENIKRNTKRSSEKQADGGSRTPVTSLGSLGNSRYTTSATMMSVIYSIHNNFCQ